MGYDSTNKILTLDGGLSLDDVGYAIGSASRVLGNLCTSPSINMWAVCKPFRSSMLKDIALEPDAYAAERKAKDCGLSIPTYTSLLSAFNAALKFGEDTLCWTYNKPRGISRSEYYRLHDFVGYRREARGPFIDYAPDASEVYAIDKLHWSRKHAAHLATWDMQQSDLATTDRTLYPGVASRVTGSSSGTLRWAKKDSSGLISMNAVTPSLGYTYDLVFFWSTEAFSDNVALPSTAKIILTPYPYHKVSLFSDFGIEFSGEANSNGASPWITLVPNTGARTRKCKSITMHTRKASNVTQLANGCYTIREASATLSDHEEDAELFTADVWLSGNNFWDNEAASGRPMPNTFSGLSNYASGVGVYIEFVYAYTEGGVEKTETYIRKATIRFPAETSS